MRAWQFNGAERVFVLVLPDAVDEAAQTIFSKLGSGISLIQTKQLKLTGA